MLGAHLEAVQAEEILREGRSLSPKALKALVLLATGDEKKANDAFSRRAEDLLAKGM